VEIKGEKEGLLLMGTQDIFNSKSLKSFIKGSLVLIGLFFVLSCVVAAYLFPFDQKIEVNKNVKISKDSDIEKNIEIKKIEIGKNTDNKVYELISVLTIPLIIFLLFLLIIICKFSCFLNSYIKSPCKKYEDILRQMKNIEDFLYKIHKTEENIYFTQKHEKALRQNKNNKENLFKTKKMKRISLRRKKTMRH